MPTITVLSFLAFTLTVAVLSYLWVRGTDEQRSEGYYLGGRSLTGWVIAGSLMLTNLSTEQIVGLNGQAYTAGVAVMAWETTSGVALVFTALYLLPRYLKGGISTISEFLADRFDETTRTISSGLFLTGYVVFFLPVVLYSGSLALAEIFNVTEVFGVGHMTSLFITVWAIGIVGSIYAIGGGLKAVAVSDSINAIGLVIGGLMIPVFGLYYIGDGDILGGLSTLVDKNPDKFDAKGEPGGLLPFSTLFTGLMLNQLFYWGTNQAIVQRAFAASSLKEGQKGLLIAGFFKVLTPIILVLPGIIAFQIFGSDLEQADDAYPRLVAEVLPPWLAGFFAAVLFGAILSSFNSVLNSSTTLFGVDIYRQHFKADASDEEVVKAGKIAGLVIALLAMGVAPFIAYAPSGLFGYLQQLNGMYAIPILTVVLLGYFTKRIPAIGAKLALIVGVVVYCISQFVIAPMVGDAYPHFLHILAVVFILLVAIMLIAGQVAPREEPYELHDKEVVADDQWRWAKAASILVTAMVVSTYLIFTG